VWKSLPNEMKTSKTVFEFKNCLINWFFLFYIFALYYFKYVNMLLRERERERERVLPEMKWQFDLEWFYSDSFCFTVLSFMPCMLDYCYIVSGNISFST
jgi:hypothetical protein